MPRRMRGLRAITIIGAVLGCSDGPARFGPLTNSTPESHAAVAARVAADHEKRIVEALRQAPGP